jgi:hypothetical protein
MEPIDISSFRTISFPIRTHFISSFILHCITTFSIPSTFRRTGFPVHLSHTMNWTTKKRRAVHTKKKTSSNPLSKIFLSTFKICTWVLDRALGALRREYPKQFQLDSYSAWRDMIVTKSTIFVITVLSSSDQKQIFFFSLTVWVKLLFKC